MGKKLTITNSYGDQIDVELDDDITEDDLEHHPEAANALTDQQIYDIETAEGADHR